MELNLFEDDILTNQDVKSKYTKKVETPIYKPNRNKPHILELMDCERTKRLVNKIEQLGREGVISEQEKRFLIKAAHRFVVFNYSKIADYYAHSNKEMQQIMEQLALVIIDFNKAIEYGFVKLQKDIQNEYNRNIQAKISNEE